MNREFTFIITFTIMKQRTIYLYVDIFSYIYTYKYTGIYKSSNDIFVKYVVMFKKKRLHI